MILPEININTSRFSNFITKPILISFLILFMLLLICSLIAFNVKIENIINTDGVLEYYNFYDAKHYSQRILVFVSENEAEKLSMGQSVKLIITSIMNEKEEMLCSGKITLIKTEQNHDKEGSSSVSNIYRLYISLDSNLNELNKRNNFNKTIQIKAKIITNDELLFDSILKKAKDIVPFF